MPRVNGYLRYLSGWIGIVALMALGNTISCFRDHGFLADRLYTGAPQQVNGLMARLFGVWTLLSSGLRLTCALDVKNMAVYHMTFVSFILALLHFVLEAFVYKTAPLTIGVAAPLVISSISILGMLLGYTILYEDDEFTTVKHRSRNDEHSEQQKVLHGRLNKNPAKTL